MRLKIDEVRGGIFFDFDRYDRAIKRRLESRFNNFVRSYPEYQQNTIP
ncbi:MAG: hypothetical protein WAP52_03115 [Candidatus Sungiibacteriota bacterium]